MPKIVDVNRTYKYRLYDNREANRRLHDTINISGIIWNHITALRKRYYRRFGKHLNSGLLQKHVSHLRMRTQRFAYWQKVGSQAVQDICQRHDKAYERFFNKEGGLPRFKKVKAYTSFTPQTSRLEIRGRHASEGKPKTSEMDGADHRFG